jgi:hypothetical protein
MSLPCAAPLPVTGRHRLAPAPTPSGRTIEPRLGRTVDLVARLGSLVTLAALLVVGGAVVGLIDDAPRGEPTVTVTFDGGQR